MRPIFYEPHPVTTERKAELRAQGFRIIDLVFAPPGHVQQIEPEKQTEVQPVKEPARRGRPPKTPPIGA